MLQTHDKWLSHATNQHLQTTYSSLKPTILEKTGFLRKTRFFFIHLELAGFASSTRKKEGSGSSRYIYIQGGPLFFSSIRGSFCICVCFFYFCVVLKPVVRACVFKILLIDLNVLY